MSESGSLSFSIMDSLSVQSADGPEDLIKNAGELTAFAHGHLLPLLESHDVVTVPRGIIDRSVFQIQNPLFAIPSIHVNALFHDHPEVVGLVPNDKNTVSTLLISRMAAARAIWETLEDEEWQRLLEDHLYVDSQASHGWMIYKVLDFFRAAYIDGYAKEHATRKNWLSTSMDQDCNISNGLTGMRVLLSNHDIRRGQNDTVTEFIRQTQRRAGAAVQEINWMETDIALIKRRIFHGRNVRESDKRQSEQLATFPTSISPQ